jgi:SAM-dependent methyltransferase
MRSAPAPELLLNDPDAFGPQFIRMAGGLGRYDTTLQDAAQAMELLGLAPGDRVLDAACGFGRFGGALHEHGCRVVGVDVSPSAIEEAKRRCAGPTYVVGDLSLPLELGSFDAIVNVFSSFGYGATLADDLRIIDRWHADLRPGGQLLMEISDAERAAHRLGTSGETIHRSHGGVDEQIRMDWETSMLHCRYERDGELLQIVMRIFSREELERYLRDAGFRDIRAYGGFDGRARTPDDRLVLVARA